MRAIVNPGWDINGNVALVLFLACALAVGAGVGDNLAFTGAVTAGSGVSEAPE